MYVIVLRERKEKETRVALSPEGVRSLVDKGFKVGVEREAGLASGFADTQYQEAGAEIHAADELCSKAEILLSVNAPVTDIIAKLSAGTVLLSFLYAASNPELVTLLKEKQITAFSMDAIPRISRAQKMDALSSQANLAGYKAVLMAADHLTKMLPMMTTAAGTIKPARVVIFGAGVAGLQAIATAKRLGAVVEVSDIRPETKEQVESLGGKFISVEQDSSVQIQGGYVTDVSADFLSKQQELIARHVREADIVITTALIPGKKAPLLVTADMLSGMRYGSVVLDMAVSQGGNVAGSVADETIVRNGITIIGESNLPALLPRNASELYSRNITAFLLHLSDGRQFHMDLGDEITAGSLITR